MRRVAVPAKIKRELQKEINSECPFCNNQDVACFEIHHIDGNRSNSLDSQNLLYTCPTCHTKIEKGEITYEEVIKIKNQLQSRPWKIEFVSAIIDSSVCNWKVSETNELAFFKGEKRDKSLFPVLNFTFINHLSKSIVLKSIEVMTKMLPSGLTGIEQCPHVLKSLIKYKIQLDYDKTINYLPLEQIAVNANSPFMFQVELSSGNTEKGIYNINRRVATYFTFKFSSRIEVKVPVICFNCNDENEPMIIRILS